MSPNTNAKMFNVLIISLSLPIFILAASISVQELQEYPCPITNAQCTCSEGEFKIVNCKNISRSDDLQDIISNLTDKTFILELVQMDRSSFPVEVLDNQFLMSMVIVNSTFDKLFNDSRSTTQATSASPQPVQSQANLNSSNLHHLSIENVTTVEEWSWSQLSFLKRLDIFFAYNTTIGDTIPSNFSQYMSKSLKFLSIAQSNISQVEPGSFTNFRNLTYLRISHSKLTTLTRNILPSPAAVGQLRLDHNLITSLPDDMFEDMPNISVVSLSNNRLSVLSEDLFRPLWKPNAYIELRNNPIKCDCRLRWVVTNPNKPNIIGECAYPKRLFRKDIKDLTEADLNC